MKHHILIIGKMWPLLSGIANRLSESNAVVYCTDSPQVAIDYMNRFNCSLVIIDFTFSEWNRISSLRKLREMRSEPILVLTGHATSDEEICTLRAGADQYVGLETESDIERCLANAQAIIRRTMLNQRGKDLSILIFGNGLRLNPKLRKAYIHGNDMFLTPKQFALLCYLAENTGQVVTKEELYHAAWKNEYDINSDAALKFHIKELRKKLEEYGITNLIETSWGTGYLLNPGADGS